MGRVGIGIIGQISGLKGLCPFPCPNVSSYVARLNLMICLEMENAQYWVTIAPLCRHTALQ